MKIFFSNEREIKNISAEGNQENLSLADLSPKNGEENFETKKMIEGNLK